MPLKSESRTNGDAYTLQRGDVLMENPDSEYAAVYQLGGTKVLIDTSMAAKTPEDRERAISIFRKALWRTLENDAMQRVKNREAEKKEAEKYDS
jgi:uncharacterized DUF497 family protein